jgi:hypothetical protein
MTMRYKTTRADGAGLRQRMKTIAKRRSFGIGACTVCSSGKATPSVLTACWNPKSRLACVDDRVA